MIVRAVAILNRGMCAATSQSAGEQHEQEADFGQRSARLMVSQRRYGVIVPLSRRAGKCLGRRRSTAYGTAGSS